MPTGPQAGLDSASFRVRSGWLEFQTRSDSLVLGNQQAKIWTAAGERTGGGIRSAMPIIG